MSGAHFFYADRVARRPDLTAVLGEDFQSRELPRCRTDCIDVVPGREHVGPHAIGVLFADAGIGGVGAERRLHVTIRRYLRHRTAAHRSGSEAASTGGVTVVIA